MSLTRKRFAVRGFLLLCIIGAGCMRPVPSVATRYFNAPAFVGLESLPTSRDGDAILDFELEAGDGKVIKVTRCSEVESLREEQVKSSEMAILRLLKMNCRSVKMYLESTSTAMTFFPPKLTERLVLDFPANAVPAIAEEEMQRRSSGQLRVYEKSIKILVIDKNTIKVVTSTDTITYIVMARGDMDGDRLEDLLLRLESVPKDGGDPAVGLILLTRVVADGPIVARSIVVE